LSYFLITADNSPKWSFQLMRNKDRALPKTFGEWNATLPTRGPQIRTNQWQIVLNPIFRSTSCCDWISLWDDVPTDIYECSIPWHRYKSLITNRDCSIWYQQCSQQHHFQRWKSLTDSNWCEMPSWSRRRCTCCKHNQIKCKAIDRDDNSSNSENGRESGHRFQLRNTYQWDIQCKRLSSLKSQSNILRCLPPNRLFSHIGTKNNQLLFHHQLWLQLRSNLPSPYVLILSTECPVPTTMTLLAFLKKLNDLWSWWR